MNHTEPDNNPTVAHEHTDADSHAITRFGIGLAFLVVVSQLLLWWVFDHFSEREAKLSPHVPAIIRMQAPTLPPEPRLQGNAPLDVNPRLDLKQMRENEDAFLNHYGWIDPDRGIVHVPIDKALGMVAQSGLPKFKPMEPKQSSREHNPQFGDWLRNSGAHNDEHDTPSQIGISLPVPELPSSDQAVPRRSTAPVRPPASPTAGIAVGTTHASSAAGVLVGATHSSPAATGAN